MFCQTIFAQEPILPNASIAIPASQINPAGLSVLDRYVFDFTQSKLFDLFRTNQIRFAIPTNENSAIGFDWNQIGFSDPELIAQKNRYGFSYSYRWSNISIGFQTTYLTNSVTLDAISLGSENGWNGKIGGMMRLNNSVTLGISASDLISFGTGIGLRRGKWIRHDSGNIEQISETDYRIGMAFRLKKWQISSDLSLFDPSRIDLKIARGFGNSKRISGQIWSGFQKDLDQASGLTLSIGTNLNYRSMAIGAIFLKPPTLPSTTFLTFQLNFDYRKLPIQIEQIRLRDLFPIHYNYYSYREKRSGDAVIVLENPNTPPNFTETDQARYYPIFPEDKIGRIWIKNESDREMRFKIQIFIDQFVSGKGTEVATDLILPPNQRATIGLCQIVLTRTALKLRHATPVEARIRISEIGGNAFRETSTTLILHGNRTTRLDEIAKLGSFISTEDPALRNFIDAIRSQFSTEISETEIPKNLTMSILILNALKGITYATDPNIPLESGTIDEIQHPYEMLNRLATQTAESGAFGDCDDSTALYCSLLETAGIKTALIKMPNHVMMAFDVGGISIADAQKLNLPDRYLSINGRVWLPIETTVIRDGFVSAWETALDQLQNGTIQDLVTVQEAWEKYGASSIRGEPTNFNLPKDQVRTQFSKEIENSLIKKFSTGAKN